MTPHSPTSGKIDSDIRLCIHEAVAATQAKKAPLLTWVQTIVAMTTLCGGTIAVVRSSTTELVNMKRDIEKADTKIETVEAAVLKELNYERELRVSNDSGLTARINGIKDVCCPKSVLEGLREPNGMDRQAGVDMMLTGSPTN